MLLFYMIFWSGMMMLAMGFLRLRDSKQFVLMAAMTGLIVLVAYALATQMATSAGLDLNVFNPLVVPDLYLRQGLEGWMVLMVLPCGWLAPMIGVNVAERMQPLA